MNYCQFRNQTIKRMAVTSSGGGLPAEYQQVEYLQNAGGANGWESGIHIDTGITYFADFEIKVRRTNNNSTKFCGSGKDYCLQRNDSAGYASFWNGSSKYVTSNAITTLAVYAWRNNVVYLNSTAVSNLTKTAVSGNFMLYGCGGYGGASFYMDLQIYYCKLFDADGNAIRDYIPCYRKADNTPGMYDLATSTFNIGTGTGYFIVGQDVQ